MSHSRVWLASLSTLLLVACGGGGGGNGSPGNAAPAAVAGADQAVVEGSAVTLDGSASFDRDGTIREYEWIQIGGPATTLANAGTDTASFTAPATDEPLALDFRLTVTDNRGASDSDEVRVTVTPQGAPVNAIPVAANDTAQTREDEAVNINVLGNDTDADGAADLDPASIAVADVQNGAAAVDTGNVIFTPAPNFNGTAGFSYTVRDRQGAQSNVATVQVTVAAVNDAPAADSATASGEKNRPLTGQLSGSDADGDTLSFALAGEPAHGDVTVSAGGRFNYSPDTSFTGSDSFTFTVSDGTATSSPATVSITITSGPNSAPQAANDSAATDEDTSVTIDVLANDSDADGAADLDPASIAVADVQNGIAAINAGKVAFTPAANFAGSGGFSYTVRDRQGVQSNPATVAITVTPVNDAPVANDASVSGQKDRPIEGQLTGSDVDGDALVFARATDAAHGTVNVTTSGSFIYTPAANYTGSDSFTFRISDGNALSAPATVSITVTAAPNSAPQAVNDSATTAEDSAVTIDVLANDSDADGVSDLDPASIAFSDVQNGGATVSDGKVTFSPAGNFNGTAGFSYTVRDRQGAQSNAATVTVTVSPVNDPPTISDVADVTIAEDGSTGPMSFTVADIDNDPGTLSVAASHGHGPLIPDGNVTFGGSGADRTVTVTPAPDQNGAITITLYVSDGAGEARDTFRVTVTPVNDAPTASDSSASGMRNRTITGQLSGSDVDGDTLSFAKASDPAHGAVTVQSDGSYTYSPSTNYTGSDGFTFTVSDGTATSAPATVSITITAPGNAAPRAFDDGAITDEDTPVTIDVLANDLDTGSALDPASITIRSERHGVATPANGKVTFLADANYFGTDAGFTYTVNDADGDTSNVATVAVTVNPVNDAPVARNSSASGDEETVITGSVTGEDIDGDALTFAYDGCQAHGTVEVSADGTFAYEPVTNFAGMDTFCFVANDGTTNSARATVSITVVDKPEATVSVDDVTVAEDAGEATFTVTLSRAPDNTVTLQYATSDGTARAGSDYTAASGYLTFDGALLSQSITVPVSNDTTHESSEMLTLALTVFGGSDSVEPASDLEATGTITDDDPEDTTSLRVGAAKRSVAPSQRHIDGALESRVYAPVSPVFDPAEPGETAGMQAQEFGLGGYGLDEQQTLQNVANPTYAHIGNGFATGNYRGIEENGEEHSTYVRALVVDKPGGDKVAFVTLDAIGAGNIIQKHLKAAVTAATGIPGDNVLFGQTHSHSAADLQGLWGGVPATWLDCDDTKLDLDGCSEDGWSKGLYQLAAEAVLEALEARVPARLSVATGPLDLNNQRTIKVSADDGVDKAMTVLQARALDGDRVVGTIMQYAAHPTIVSDDSRLVHTDYVLSGLVRLEQQGGTALYYNGPIAGVSPRHHGDPACAEPNDRYCNARIYGRDLADHALALLADPAKVIEVAPTLSVRHATNVRLPVTNPAFLATGGARMFNRYYNFVETPVDDVPAVQMFRNELPQVAPMASTTVSRVTLGNPSANAGLEIATIPGEGRNSLGQLVRHLAYGADKASRPMMLLGLTHNSFGYIIPEHEFAGGMLIEPTNPGDGLYEEIVSLGPLTAPLLRLQAYFPLFDAPPEAYAPEYVTACQASADSNACMLELLEWRAGQAPGNTVRFIDDGLGQLAERCRGNMPAPFDALCAVTDALAGLLDDGLPPGGAGDSRDAELAATAADALARGCDLLDPSHCLLPFPNDHFTVDAAAGSPQGTDADALGRRGTGKRINFNVLAMPRNSAGKPVDPGEWNRNDGFSPGQLIVTYVPNLGTVKDESGKPLGPIAGAVPITDIPRYLDADAPILVIDTTTGERHPIWAETNLDAGYLLPMQAFGPRNDGKPALLIRPAKSFVEGRRYVVVLRNLKDDAGASIAAQAPFTVCRDEIVTNLPALQGRCSHLDEHVFPVLDDAGIARDESLYLAWDFTVASARNNVARLERMRDDAFASLGDTAGSQPGDAAYPAGAAPTYTVTRVTENPDGANGKTVRRIQGTLTVPSYVIAADPSPLDGDSGFHAVLNAFREQYPGAGQQVLDAVAAQCQEQGGPEDFCAEFRNARGGDIQDGAGLAASGSLPPNRLHYLPDATSPGACDPDAAQIAGGCALQARHGDGLPDRNPAGDLTTTFTCNIPRSAVNGAANMDAATSVRVVRPTLYGHGLLGGHGEGNGQASDFGNRYGFMTCMTDWFGFATGDVANVASALVDLSNFPVVPDGTQQGVLNQLFLARLAVHPAGFAADPLFQVGGRPVFDRREVFYHGNSQGGIVGGVVLAASKDVNRGMLGVPGMNYSTLLSRSTDFASYSVPMYLSYTDDLDRPFLMSLMQMLWDRSENNGYAGHMTSDAMNGPDNAVLLHPAFGDHQVTMWSVDVMARTLGARVDRKRVDAARHPDSDASEYALIEPIEYGNAAHAAGSALVPFDEQWLTSNDRRCHAGSRTAPPPIGNVPPERHAFEVPETGQEIEEPLVTPTDAGADPHECPRRDPQARCQTSHFLQRAGTLIDPALASREFDDTAHGCAAIVIDDAPGAETPAPNGGLLGALGAFTSALNEVVMDALEGDIGGAPQGVLDAVAQFVADAQDAVGEGSAGEVVGLEDDPEQVLRNRTTAERSVEPVVLTGDRFVAWTVPQAQGAPYPYPSGAVTTGQLFDEDPTGTFPGQVRDAHNGVMLYPQAGAPMGVEVSRIAAWRYAPGDVAADANGFVEIPVQVDQRFPYFLANANSDFSVYSGTDEELTYEWNPERWSNDDPSDPIASYDSFTPDPVTGLDNDDEVVFMARDAGSVSAPQGLVPADADFDAMQGLQQVVLTDVLDPVGVRYAYVGLKQAGKVGRYFDRSHYVDYERRAEYNGQELFGDQWVDRYFFPENSPEKLGTSLQGYGPNREGVVRRDGYYGNPAACDAEGICQSNDRFPRDSRTVTTDTYRWVATGRWMIRNLSVTKEGTVRDFGPDLVDRWKGRAFQQNPDSYINVIGGFEEEQTNWEANSSLLGERCGPVRCIREIWGADSGTNVTKTETFYRDAITYRYHVRVHPIPPDGLYTSWDYNRSVMVPAEGENVPAGRYYTAMRPQGVLIDGRNDDIGQIDGVMPFVPGTCPDLGDQEIEEPQDGVCPMFFDTADPLFNLPIAFNNWEQVSGKGGNGSLVYLFEMKGASSLLTPAVVPYYRDDACFDDGTGDDPVQRPWPGDAGFEAKVRDAYVAAARARTGNDELTYADLKCEDRQGAYASHGVHYFATGDMDNAFVMGKPVNEVDGQQWQFIVPTAAPRNVGDRYANVVRAPLQAVVTPSAPSGGGGGGGVPEDYETCVAMAQQGGASDEEAAVKFACAVIFGGGREDGEAGEGQIQGPNTYIPMADGTLIAANVYIPWGCNVAKNPAATPCAAILEMSGYESGSDEGETPAHDLNEMFKDNDFDPGLPLQGGTRAAHEKYYKSLDRYVSVTANVRGTGCSAGEFDLFSRKSAEDGKHLIDEWIAKQPWSNRKVGIFGHSYSGITGAMIASTHPRHLKMVSVSGQVGDVYRDITYPGGVSNYGFPLLWTGGVRPAYDYLGASLAGVLADSPASAVDPIGRQCARNQAERSRTVTDDPLVKGTSDTDTEWFQHRSVVNSLLNVTAPTQIVTAYQDEQTGPRGGTNVFDHLPQNLTRRLVTLNGDHGTQTSPREVLSERRYWMDRFMLDANDPIEARRPRAWGLDEQHRPLETPLDLVAPVIADDGTATSRVLLEVDGNLGTRSNGHIDSSGFPLAQTQWTDFYFQADGTLDTAKSTVHDDEPGGFSTYFSGSKRQAYSFQAGKNAGGQVTAQDAGGADELVFALDVNAVAQDYTATGGSAQKAFVIAGPITADLWIASAAIDTELMVQLIDADPATGERLYLQRGVLKASHNHPIEWGRSQCAAQGSGGRLTRECRPEDNVYRPHRVHQNPQNVVPFQATRYLLEIFPVGHVLREGHQLLVKVHAPSLDDNDWAYIQKTAPTLNTLYHSAEHPSSIRLPVIPVGAVSRLGPPLSGTCTDNEMRCVMVSEPGTGGGAPANPFADYRSDCYEYGAMLDQTPDDTLATTFCDFVFAGPVFDDGSGSGGGGAEPGPVTQLASIIGGVLNQIADAYLELLGNDGNPGQLRAGVGVVDMTPDVGYWTGQHGGDPGADFDAYAMHKAKGDSYGVQSRLTARAIVVEGGNGKRIVLLKTDNYLAQDSLVRRVAQILDEGNSGIGYDQILYHVTHDHSSTYGSSPSAGVWIFQDAFDPRFFEFQARKMAQAIELAAANMKPARMGAIEVRHKIFKGNVVGMDPADDGSPAGYPREYGDHGLVVMRFDDMTDPANPVPLAAWVNWGEHPESLNSSGYGQNGFGLHSADYLGPLERFVERDIGAPLVFSQGDVGSAEGSGNSGERLGDDGVQCSKQPTPDATCQAGGVARDWNRRAYSQFERNVRYLADDIARAWHQIGEIPADSTASREVQFSSNLTVDYLNAWVPGPVSHPYPAVSNCRTQPTAEGQPARVPGPPECFTENPADDGAPWPSTGPLQGPVAMVYQTMKAEGVPVPDSIDLPSFGSLEENARLKLQVFRLGDVLLASCACEAQVDLILNLESRLDRKAGEVYDGFDWACLLPSHSDEAVCEVQKQYYDPAEFPTSIPGSWDNSNGQIDRMHAQVHNPADGWDAPEYAPFAGSEPLAVEDIKGNFTRQEIQKLGGRGYRLPVGIGHAGDYNGYTVSYREYMRGDHYRKSLTAYGPHTADYMATRLVRMAAQLQGGVPFETEIHAAAAQADEARMLAQSRALGETTKRAYDAYYAALPPDVGPEAVVAEPALDLGLFNAATFSWTGGSAAIDNPIVNVEVCDGAADRDCTGGTWKVAAEPSGEVQTQVTRPEFPAVDVYTGQQQWTWTANFETYEPFPARLGGTQAGFYRFVARGCINDGSAPSENVLNRIQHYVNAVLPGTSADPFAPSACLAGSRQYELTSRVFEVVAAADVVTDVQADAGGDLTFNVSTTSIPRTYESSFKFIRLGQAYCDTCSFRPWASSSAGIASVRVDVGGVSVTATGSGANWSADTNLAAGQSATITVTYTDGRVGRPVTFTRGDTGPVDSDGDGVPDEQDAFPNDPAESADADGDGTGDNADADDDNDGVADGADACASTPAGTPVGADGCAVEPGEHASCTAGSNLDGSRSYQVTELTSETGQTISFQVLEPTRFDCANRANGAHPLILQGHGFGGHRSVSGFDKYRDAGYTVVSIDQRGFGDSDGTVRVMDPDVEGKDLVQILNWVEANLDYLAYRDESLPGKPFAARPAGGTSVAGGVNLVAGAIGGSYGGGYQLLIHNVDEKDRLDALAPDITWHDLRWSVNPYGTIKSAWDLLLAAGGEVGSTTPGALDALSQGQKDPPNNFEPGFQTFMAGGAKAGRGLDPYIKEMLITGAAQNQLPQDGWWFFRYHSPQYWCAQNDEPAMRDRYEDYYRTVGFDALYYVDPLRTVQQGEHVTNGTSEGQGRRGQPAVDVLLSQGFRDTLFNVNEAWWNYQCLKARGGDVRLLTHQGGHNLDGYIPKDVPRNAATTFQKPAGTNNCSSLKRDDATLQWMDERLRGLAAGDQAAKVEDDLCVSLTENDAVMIPPAEFLARKDARAGIPDGQTSFYEVQAGVSSVPNGSLARHMYLSGAQPAVVPLLEVTDHRGLILAGIPQGSFTVTTPLGVSELGCQTIAKPPMYGGGFGPIISDQSCDSISFVGLGVLRTGQAGWELIDDQLTPIRWLGEHPDLDLVGVAERLHEGDQLGLLVYGYHPQYLASYSRQDWIAVVNVAADLKLPLYAATSDAKDAAPDFTRDPLASFRPLERSTDGVCTNPGAGFVDPSCFATGSSVAMLRTVCDYQWIPTVCEFATLAPEGRDPGYAVGDDPSPGQPLVQVAGAVHNHSGYSDGDPSAIPADYFRAARVGHNISDADKPPQHDTGVKLDFMIGSEHSDNEKLSITTAEVCVGGLANNPDAMQDSFDARSPLPFLGFTTTGLVNFLSCNNALNGDHYFKWQATLEQAIEGTERDGDAYSGFTAMRGFEYTNDYYNHLNVYLSSNVVNVKNDGSYADLGVFWDWLREPVEQGGGADALVTFNHPGGNPHLSPFDGGAPTGGLFQATKGGANWNDVAYVDAEVDERVFGMEVNGGDDIEFFVKGLTNGWHLSPVANEDEHQREWATSNDGKTLVYLRGRGPQDYYHALKDRRTAAVHNALVNGAPGTKVQVPSILYWADGDDFQSGQPLGSRIAGAGEHTLRIEITGLAQPAKVALIGRTGGADAAPIALGASSDGAFSATHVVTAPSSGEDWYFVVLCPATEAVCDADRTGYFALTAPIWFKADATTPADADGDGVPDAADQCADTPADTPVDANGCPIEQAEGLPLCADTIVDGVHCISELGTPGQAIQDAVDALYAFVSDGGLPQNPSELAIDCTGPAGDPEPGTPEFAKRDADNIYCTTERHQQLAQHPANNPYMMENYGADPYRAPVRHDGKRFRHEDIDIAGVDDQAGYSFHYGDSNAEIYLPCAAETCAEMPEGLQTFEPPYPIVIVMHGAASDKKHLEWVAQPLAERGYFVLTANGTGNQLPTILLDWLDSDANPYRNDVDLSRIGTVGHSLGAENATRVQGDGDPLQRVSGIVAFDPCNGDGYNECKNSQGSKLHGQGAKATIPTLFLTADYLGFPGYPQPQVSVPGDLRVEGFDILRDNGIDTMLVTPRATTHLDWAGAFTFGNRLNEATSLYYTLAWFDRYVKGKLVVENGVVATPPDRTEAEERTYRQAVADAAFEHLTAAHFDGMVDLHNISQGYYDPQKFVETGDEYSGNVPFKVRDLPLADRLSFYHRSVCFISRPDYVNGGLLARADTTEGGDMRQQGCPVVQASTDSDGDGVPDAQDAFPIDPTESADADGDGTGDNADTGGNPLTQLVDNLVAAVTSIVENVTTMLASVADAGMAFVDSLIASPETAQQQLAGAAQDAADQVGVVATDNPWVRRRPLNISHRGGEQDWPENTMYAYAESIREAGSDMIEMDIYETADGELVVIHNDTVDNTTNGSGAVSSLTLAQIQALDAAYWFAQGEDGTRHGTNHGRTASEYVYRGIATGVKAPPAGYRAEDFRIPTLRQIFENPAFADVFINIELKPDDDSTGSYEAKLAAMIREYAREDDVMVASFLDHNLALFKANAPEIATSVPTGQAAVDKGAGSVPGAPDGTHPGLGATVAHKAFQVPMEFEGIEVLTEEYVADAHARGMAVHAWTINDRDDMLQLLNWCVDGIMSDEPLLLEEVLQSGEWSCPLDAPTAAAGLSHFVGSLHEHSGWSDGEIATTPADYFDAGLFQGLDFVGGSEHSDNAMAPVTASTKCFSFDFPDCFQLSPDGVQKWNATGAIADAKNDPGVFSAIRGFEWTSDRFGHINVFFSQHDLNAKTSTGSAVSMEDFWRWLALPPSHRGGNDGLAVFNHPGREDRVHHGCVDEEVPDEVPLVGGQEINDCLANHGWPGDPSYAWNDLAYRPEHDGRVVGIEMYGKGDHYYDAGNGAPLEGWYAHALDMGWHVAPVGAEDEHGTEWATPQRAKTVMLAKENTRAALRGAMAARRFYALAHHHGDIRLAVTAGGRPMGSRIVRPSGTELEFSVEVSDINPDNGVAAKRIEVIGPGGQVIESHEGLSHTFRAMPAPQEGWRYVRVRGVDGTETNKVLAVSAPIWFRAN